VDFFKRGSRYDRLFENGMEVTRAERQIDDVGNCRND